MPFDLKGINFGTIINIMHERMKQGFQSKGIKEWDLEKRLRKRDEIR